MEVTGTMVGDGDQVQVVDGGLAQVPVGHLMALVEVLDSGLALDRVQGLDQGMGMVAVVLKVEDMGQEAAALVGVLRLSLIRETEITMDDHQLGLFTTSK